MHGLIWIKFKKDGYRGSVSVWHKSENRIDTDPGFDDKPIHEAVHEMDSEYTYVKVIHEGYKGSGDIMTVELGDNPKANKRALDDAILEGLAHSRIFREARTGAIVQFGYDLNEA
jgi:hypothetical protein